MIRATTKTNHFSHEIFTLLLIFFVIYGYSIVRLQWYRWFPFGKISITAMTFRVWPWKLLVDISSRKVTLMIETLWICPVYFACSAAKRFQYIGFIIFSHFRSVLLLLSNSFNHPGLHRCQKISIENFIFIWNKHPNVICDHSHTFFITLIEYQQHNRRRSRFFVRSILINTKKRITIKIFDNGQR